MERFDAKSFVWFHSPMQTALCARLLVRNGVRNKTKTFSSNPIHFHLLIVCILCLGKTMIVQDLSQRTHVIQAYCGMIHKSLFKYAYVCQKKSMILQDLSQRTLIILVYSFIDIIHKSIFYVYMRMSKKIRGSKGCIIIHSYYTGILFQWHDP